jgi:hypothetical protein
MMPVDVNHAPVARADRVATAIDTLVYVLYPQLLANDSPGPGDRGQRLRVVDVAATPGTHGTVRMVGGHAYYVPAPGFAGQARFRYTVRDNGGTEHGGVNTDSGWVRVTVG